MSRPIWSVPSQKRRLGASLNGPTMASGSWGAMIGASTAARQITLSRIRLATPRWWCLKRRQTVCK